MSAIDALFQEPAEFYKPEEAPTFINYERKRPASNEPEELTLRLVGKSPLWGHLLWNAGRVTAEWVDEHRQEIEGKSVLELGAAAGLPSLLAGLVARNVVVTDYPDPDLIDNITYNSHKWQEQVGRSLPIHVGGYIWGHDVDPLLNAPGQNGHKFDLIVMSDLVFNHSEHEKLLKTCVETLEPTGRILLVFSPHRPKLIHKDLEFLDRAKQLGLAAEKIIERRMSPMFEEEEETRELRSMVYGYLLHFAST